MFSSVTVVIIICLYMGMLFVVARWAESKTSSGKSLTNNPYVYSLAIAVYCTAWTYYGSVGTAANSGFLFLTFYLGPTLVIAMWGTILRKLVRIKSTHRITSIADFISARYNRSQFLATLVTLIAVVGITPYVALQFRAVESAFSLIVVSADASAWSEHLRGVGVVVLLVSFTVLLGMRRLDPTERHPGMVMALAVECLVKLCAFLAAGIFVTYFMFDGITDILGQLPSHATYAVPKAAIPEGLSPFQWAAYLILGMSAIMFLPRQFHVQVVENLDEKHIKTAMWVFPLYMLVINIFVFPIAAAGLLTGNPIELADTFVLGLPIAEGRNWLSLFIFVGGFSAAAGMIMVSSITISTMVVNHFLLPLIAIFKSLQGLRHHLLFCRWIAAAGFISAGYLTNKVVGQAYILGSLGIISFAAVLQLAPAMIGGLFWRRGNKMGAILGLSAGFIVWAYTLLIPAFVKSGWASGTILGGGLFGLNFFHPESLFGLVGLDRVTHAVFWTLSFNVGLYFLGSLYFDQSQEERSRTEEFVGILEGSSRFAPIGSTVSDVDVQTKRVFVERLFSRYFSSAQAAALTYHCMSAVGIWGKGAISIVELAELQSEIERTLAGSIGAAEAHRAVRESAIFTESERKRLSTAFADMLADLRLTPLDLKKRIDYYKEREALLSSHATDLEEKVQERTHDLEVAVRELKDFAYVVSHDLQSPLRAISQLAGWLQDDYAEILDDTGKRNLNLLRGRVKRMRRLINGLLEYSRIGRSEEREQTLDLNQVIHETAALVASPDKVRIVVDGLLPSVRCHPPHIELVFRNLVDNAVKFMDKPNGLVRITCNDEGDHWLFCVSDNGPGIDPKYSEKIFQIFQTLASRDEFESTGIGLTMVRKIVELNGGRVWLESELGKGSTFFFTLPQYLESK